jgi:hypothetical protein
VLGNPLGVVDALATDGTDVAAALLATTLKVYVIPLVNPLITHGLFLAVHVRFPGLDVAT